MDTAADDKPATSFDTASQTWKNMARVAVLCSRAEFASNDGNEGTMRREVIGGFITLFKSSSGENFGRRRHFLFRPEKPDGFGILSESFKNFPAFCSSGEVDKESAICTLYLILLHCIFVCFLNFSGRNSDHNSSRLHLIFCYTAILKTKSFTNFKRMANRLID